MELEDLGHDSHLLCVCKSVQFFPPLPQTPLLCRVFFIYLRPWSATHTPMFVTQRRSLQLSAVELEKGI